MMTLMPPTAILKLVILFLIARERFIFDVSARAKAGASLSLGGVWDWLLELDIYE